MINFKTFTGLFKSKPKPKDATPKPVRFPGRAEAASWVHSTVEHAKKHDPENAHHLFNPASGEYMPLRIHVGSNWHDHSEAQAAYRQAKKNNPDLVKKAKADVNGLAGRVSQSRIQDHGDGRDDGYYPSN